MIPGPFQCWICQRAFSTKKERKNHLASTVHRRVEVACVFCTRESWFGRMLDLRTHTKKAHRLEYKKLAKNFWAEENGLFSARWPIDYRKVIAISSMGSFTGALTRGMMTSWLAKHYTQTTIEERWKQAWNPNKDSSDDGHRYRNGDKIHTTSVRTTQEPASTESPAPYTPSLEAMSGPAPTCDPLDLTMPARNSHATESESPEPATPSQNERPLDDMTALQERAKKLLRLFPAEREWGTTSIQLYGVTWPPNDWQRMNAEEKYIRWQHLARATLKDIDPEAFDASVNTRELLGRFNMLALAGMAIHRPGDQEKDASLWGNFYTFRRMCSIARGQTTGLEDESIVEMMEAASDQRTFKTDMLCRRLDRAGIPIRINEEH